MTSAESERFMYDGFAVREGLRTICSNFFDGTSIEESLTALDGLITAQGASDLGSSKKLARLVERRMRDMENPPNNTQEFIAALTARARAVSARQAVLGLVAVNHAAPATR